MKTKHYRQGDVLLIVIAKQTIVKPRQPENGRLILARGEATGHHHSVDAGMAMLGETATGLTVLEVHEATPFIHQEHGPIPLREGSHEVRRQREYSPEAIRNVAD